MYIAFMLVENMLDLNNLNYLKINSIFNFILFFYYFIKKNKSQKKKQQKKKQQKTNQKRY